MAQRRLMWALAAASLVLGACGSGTGTQGGSASPSPTSSASAGACPSGTTPDSPGPADQARPELSPYDTPAAQDEASGDVVVGEGALVGAAGTGTLQSTWTFDVCANTWKKMAPAIVSGSSAAAQGGAPIMQFVRHDASGLTLGLPVGLSPVWTYSLADDVWTELPSSGTNAENPPHSVYDPVRHQLLDWNGESVLRSYDLGANQWSGPIGQGGPGQVPGQASWFSFDTAEGVAVLTLTDEKAKKGQTWTFDPVTQSWRKRSASPKQLSVAALGGPEVAYDAAHARTVVFVDGVLATYDAAKDKWEVVKPGSGWPEMKTVDDELVGPLARTMHTLVYDTLNQRVLMFGGLTRMADDDKVVEAMLDDVWAYDLADNSWTELVAARTPPRTIPAG